MAQNPIGNYERNGGQRNNNGIILLISENGAGVHKMKQASSCNKYSQRVSNATAQNYDVMSCNNCVNNMFYVG